MGIWTETMDADLRRFHEQGYSSSQIAAKMSGHLSRNAVIGRVHRLGMSRPMVRIVREPKPPRIPREHKPVNRISRANGNSNHLRVFESSTTDLAPLRCVEIEPLHISLADLTEATCKYPFGDGPFTFCGHQASVGSYCSGHRALAYHAPQRISEGERARRRRQALRNHKSMLALA